MRPLIAVVLLILSPSPGFRGQSPESPSPREKVIFQISDLPVVPQAPIPGEILRYLEGQQHGFKRLSFAVAQIEPGSGPPLHRHGIEEAHIVVSGKVAYQIGDRTLTADGPFIARLPAGVDHSLKNIGSDPITVMGVFPTAVASEIDARR